MKLDEIELLESARNGDQEAFKELIIRYEGQVARTVIGMLGYCPEAEDIGQEVFIRFYKALGQFKGESSVGTYLTRIAINLSLNELKRRKRKALFFFFKPGTKNDSRKEHHAFDQIPYHRNPGFENEINELVWSGIEKLEPKFRSVIVLRLIDGYSTAETAEILNLPMGTVLSRLARGQEKLKEILKPLRRGEQ